MTEAAVRCRLLRLRVLSGRPVPELFLSPRTVGYHLYKAFPKLGVTAREGLTRCLP